MTLTYKLLSLHIIILSLFSGCTPPSAFTFFKKDKLKANAIQYTRKSQIVNEGVVEAIINVTYLNPVDDDFNNDKQNFIIGVFIPKDETNKINNELYQISLNDKAPIYFKELQEQHKMYGHIPLHTNWAKYYLAEFETPKDTYNLAFKLTNIELKKSTTIKFKAE